ncbi:MAG: dipeptide ABC transporter ATP-binding protein [Bauldia sp.]|nr:dipeptide ABC transporter ATP-binding protein [Bauldia sp.]
MARPPTVAAQSADGGPVLEFRGLDVRFATPDGEVHAVRGIDMTVMAGETVAVVGESGSGKSQAMMAAMGLLAKNGAAAGSVRYRGEEILGLPPRRLNRVRGARITMIFQEPMTSLDPLYRIGHQIAEPLVEHAGLSRDAARQRAIELLNDLKARLGMAIVFITHDLGIVRRFADRLYVMRAGAVVENGPTAEVIAAPRHPYTRMLLAAEPTGAKSPPPPDAPILLAADDLRVTFTIGGGFLAGKPHVIRAVDGVTLRLKEAQTIGVVGESGSGKSTLGRLLLRLLDGSGRISFEGRDLTALDRRAMRPLRREMQIVFQDPYGSLSPRLTVLEIVSEGLRVHEPSLSGKERARRAHQALAEVGLDPATCNRYPHEFSGGQRQRIAIARAIILKPKIVVLDEPTSALDRSVQKQIIELLRRLQDTLDLSYLFISHDLAVVRAMADYILVMKDGRVVEEGETEQIFAAPRDAYTRTLMTAAFDLTAFGARASA